MCIGAVVLLALTPTLRRTYERLTTAPAHDVVQQFLFAAAAGDSGAISALSAEPAVLSRALAVHENDSVALEVMAQSLRFSRGRTIGDTIIADYAHDAAVCPGGEITDIQFQLVRQADQWRVRYFGGIC